MGKMRFQHRHDRRADRRPLERLLVFDFAMAAIDNASMLE
jgi:hypothetical protein